MITSEGFQSSKELWKADAGVHLSTYHRTLRFQQHIECFTCEQFKLSFARRGQQ